MPLAKLALPLLALPRPADKLYQWPDFYGFLDVLRLTALVLRTPEDFANARALSLTSPAAI